MEKKNKIIVASGTFCDISYMPGKSRQYRSNYFGDQLEQTDWQTDNNL